MNLSHKTMKNSCLSVKNFKNLENSKILRRGKIKLVFYGCLLLFMVIFILSVKSHKTGHFNEQ